MSNGIEYKPNRKELEEQVRVLKKKRDELLKKVEEKNRYAATVVEASILRNEIERLEEELK